MKLNQLDLDKIAEMVDAGFGSRLIAKKLNNKVSFQAISLHVKRIKNKQFKASIEGKLNVIYKQLVGIEQKLGIIPEGEVNHIFFQDIKNEN